MILSRVSDYLKEHRRASLTDLALGLDATPDALQGMLAILERKGRVRRLPSATKCSGCAKCDPQGLEVYEWTAD
ncbi:MAG: FeoC-like transcriptional regulator [Candidatus Accumulibacter sp. UW26]|jgi:Mn-dependent DtxR family transcriptional regulator